MDDDWGCRRRHVAAKPGEAQRNDRTVATSIFELAGEPLHAFGRVQHRKERKAFGRKRVNACHGRCKISGKFRWRRKRMLGVGRARKAAHDEADAKAVSACEFGKDFRRFDTGGVSLPDQFGFAIHPQRTRRDPFCRGRPAQYEPVIPAGKRPGFHVRTAGQALQAGNIASMASPCHDRFEQRFHCLSTSGFACRLEALSLTDRLKSSANQCVQLVPA